MLSNQVSPAPDRQEIEKSNYLQSLEMAFQQIRDYESKKKKEEVDFLQYQQEHLKQFKETIISQQASK